MLNLENCFIKLIELFSTDLESNAKFLFAQVLKLSYYKF